MRSALILSKWNGGGVRLAAGILRRHGYRPVLVSALPDDLNAGACDQHVVVDWDNGKPDDLTSALAAAEIEPVAVVNMVEALIPWQLDIATRFGLPSPGPGMRVLLSKAALREFLRTERLSDLPFATGAADRFDVTAVDFYPAIAKPATDSGASRFVRRLNSEDALRAYLTEVGAEAGAATEVLVEGFIDGVEFSVDGPVEAGQFRPFLVFEKPEHDDMRLHDAGLLVSPPQQPAVARAAERLADVLTTLASRLGLYRCWLHAEGRVRADGTVEFVEINTRPGGGAYATAIRHATGVDPIEASVLMALPGNAGVVPDPVSRTGRAELLGITPVEAFEIGTVRCPVTVAELTELPGVLDAYVLDGYRVTSLDRENFFAEALVTGADMSALDTAATHFRTALRFTVQPH